MEMGCPVLEIKGLVKRYRGKNGVLANDGIDLTVRPGQVVGLLGHNGAGKTTLVNALVGLIRPDAGSITLAGVDAIAQPSRARQLTAIQAQANIPLDGLTPRTAVTLVTRMRGVAKTAAQARAAELIATLDIGEWADKPSARASGGINRLTAFCMTAAAPAALHVFDEPTNDVDPARRRLLWGEVRALADRGGAVLLTTHNVREAETAVDHVVIVDHGRVVTAGSPAAIAEQTQTADLEQAYLALAGAPANNGDNHGSRL